MTTFEELVQEAFDEGVEVIEDKHLPSHYRGLYLCDHTAPCIVLRPGMPAAERTCVLAEELGHHQTAFADLRTAGYIQLQRQELQALAWAIERLVPWDRLRAAYDAGAWTRYRCAAYLDISEDFLDWVIAYYEVKHPARMAALRVAQPIPGSGNG